MTSNWIKFAVLACIVASCHHDKPPDGLQVELQLLSDNHLSKDYSNLASLEQAISDVNCADSAVLRKKIVLAKDFRSWDTSQILLVPFVSDGVSFKSSAYSDVKNRFIFISPAYIRQFTLKNTLNDSLAYAPVLKLMLLHEAAHFLLNRSGAFDELSASPTKTGQQRYDTEPEFLTSVKKLEMSADSLAIDIVKRKLASKDYNCLGAALDIQLVLPGMQFQLAGTRIIENFPSNSSSFLHDPSNDHPNLELRVTFMNYFLYPSDSLRQMIDDYLYNRTVAPVSRQLTDPRIFQGDEKKLPEK